MTATDDLDALVNQLLDEEEPSPFSPTAHRFVLDAVDDTEDRLAEWNARSREHAMIRRAAHGLLIACELALQCVTDPNVRSQLSAAISLARGPQERTDR